MITILGTNDSGSTLTAFNMTLPFSPNDINAYIDGGSIHSQSSKVTPTTNLFSFIDANDNTESNRKLYIPIISVANSADYIFCFTADYEITGK